MRRGSLQRSHLLLTADTHPSQAALVQRFLNGPDVASLAGCGEGLPLRCGQRFPQILQCLRNAASLRRQRLAFDLFADWQLSSLENLAKCEAQECGETAAREHRQLLGERWDQAGSG